MKISQIISSYNRPVQLDLLLRSIHDNWPECDQVTVLWKIDNSDFKEGYAKLFTKFSNTKIGKNYVSFYQEDNFKNNLISLITNCKHDYIIMNSDDNIFINRVDFKDKKKLGNDCVAFSLRLSEDINYCLPAKLKIEIPKLYYGFEKYHINHNGIICWDWTKCDRRGAYGYPQPYDSNIYRKQWLINILKDKSFKNPYEAENVLNTNRDFTKPYMVAFKEPKLINIMYNSTGQNDNPNMKGRGLSTEALNKKYLDGFRIKTEGLYGMKVKQCHIFYQYEFEKG